MKIIGDELNEGDFTMVDATVEDTLKLCVQDMRVATGVLGTHDTPDLKEMVGEILGEEFASLMDAVAHLADRFGQSVPDDIYEAAEAIDEHRASGKPKDQHVIVLQAQTFNGEDHTLVFNHRQAIDFAHTVAEWSEALHDAGNCGCEDHGHGEETG